MTLLEMYHTYQCGPTDFITLSDRIMSLLLSLIVPRLYILTRYCQHSILTLASLFLSLSLSLSLQISLSRSLSISFSVNLPQSLLIYLSISLNLFLSISDVASWGWIGHYWTDILVCGWALSRRMSRDKVRCCLVERPGVG